MQGNTSHGKEWNKKAHHKTRENRVLPTDQHHQFEITALLRSDYGVKAQRLRCKGGYNYDVIYLQLRCKGITITM